MSDRPDLASILASRCPGLTAEDISSAVSSAQFPAVDVPFGTVDPANAVAASELVEGDGGQGGITAQGIESGYPEAFRCYYEDEDEAFKVQDPYVSTPSGTIEATGDVAGQGSYYCVVKKSSGDGESATYSAEITSDPSGESSEEEHVVASVPLFDILSNGEIHQHHVGVIVVSGEAADPADGSGLELNDDNELDLVDREESDEFAVHEVKKGSGDDAEVVAKVLATDDFEITGGVESLNSKDGKMYVIGGEHIIVETDGQTIKISYDEDKEDPDPDPRDPDPDPCSHPGDDEDGNGGGVSPDDDDDSGGGGGGGDGGVGVIAGGDEPHIGDSGCEGCNRD